MRNHFDPLPVQAAPDPHTRRPTNPQAPLDQPGWSHAPSSALACLAVCLLTALLVFALPFAVPVHSLPTISAPFVAGFSNRAAILSAAAIGVAVLVWSWRRPSPPTTASAPQAVDAHQLRPALIGVVVLATCLLSPSPAPSSPARTSATSPTPATSSSRCPRTRSLAAPSTRS